MSTAVHTLAVRLAVQTLACRAVLVAVPADALRTAHPLLGNEAARTYRVNAANHFAQIMPLVKPSLLAGSENKTEDRAAGKALLKRMDRAAQTPECMTPIARRGYVRTVYDDRAFQVCELFGAAHRAGVKLPRGARVASLGGGPGCCLLGYRVFERIAFGSATSRLWVYDYARAWEDDVAALAQALGEPIPFGGCDLARGLHAPENAEVRALAPTYDVVLLSRTLSEVPDRGWTPFLRELWATLKAGAIVFVKDEQDVEDEAVRLLGGAAWSVPGVRGVFLRRGE
jgi:hypothetical protein